MLKFLLVLLGVSITVYAADYRAMDLQNVLIRGKTLICENPSSSRKIALHELHSKINAIVDTSSVDAVTSLSGCSPHKQEKFCNITRTLVNFVGWYDKSDLSSLMTNEHKSYGDYLRLIVIAENFEKHKPEIRNLSVAKARLTLLELEDTMHRLNQTYDAADPGAVKREWIYGLFEEASRQGSRMSLVEMADLISKEKYQPKVTQSENRQQIKELMEVYNQKPEGSPSSSEVSIPTQEAPEDVAAPAVVAPQE